ncbi:O-acetyl-ADP-ribose deacetylase [Rhodococcus sp. NPDC003318]|uniref:O-acetyl-ADP-ribose deacetylase n=1 Tax=Rhodococcus sp. NPDC003318 TaxID=3364503 RepID=UPI003677A52C
MPWARPKPELWAAATAPEYQPRRAAAGPRIGVVRGDITTMRVDAIVNAAKPSLLGGGGVDGAIHRAGGRDILAACRLLRETTLPDGLAVGAAVATTAGRLPATTLIHTVGPRWSPDDDRSALLRAAYTRSLTLAASLGAKTVAFPLISSGAYGWPKDDAIRQAIDAIRSSRTTVEVVTLVAFSADTEALIRRALG